MTKNTKQAILLIEDILNAQYHNCKDEKEKQQIFDAFIHVHHSKKLAKKYINELYQVFMLARKDINNEKEEEENGKEK